jgi:uncharacterized protein YndB with AHSA1/START domain
MSQDQIAREIEIAASIDRVWSVLTEPEFVGTWFGTGVESEIDLRPGGIMVIDHGDYGKFSARIVDVSPPHVLTYRWASAFPGVVADASNSTLVKFTLQSTTTGTLLRVVESGFSSLHIPEGQEGTAGYQSHADGWTGMVQRLADFAEGKAVEPLPAAT